MMYTSTKLIECFCRTVLFGRKKYNQQEYVSCDVTAKLIGLKNFLWQSKYIFLLFMKKE